jgi:hypothetical protein
VFERGGLTYCNDDDRAESCTVLVEHRSDELELLAWRPAASTAPVPLPARKAA